MPMTLLEQLKRVDCAYEYYPEQLQKLHFTDGVKNKVVSFMYPSLKEFVSNKIPVICVDTSAILDFNQREKLFGYLYTYSVKMGIGGNKIPVIRTRDEIQNLIEDKDIEQFDSCPILFVDGANRNAGYYDKKAILDFSNFLYYRCSRGLITVLSLTNSKQDGEVFTPFVYSYLSNIAEHINVE